MTTILPSSSNASVPKAKNNTEHEEYVPQFLARTDILPIIIAILIIALNSWVIVLVAKKRNLRTVTNFILASLALSDLCTGAVSVPLYLTCNTTQITGFCTADMILIVFTSVSTVLHILVITIDRYVCIIYALRYQIWVTERRGFFVIALVWFVSVFVSLIQMAWIDLNEDLREEYDAEARRNFFIFDIFCFVALICFPVVLMGFTYARIFYEVLRQTRNIHKNNTPGWQETTRCTKREWKVAAIFLFMLLVFLVCWLPFTLLRLEGFVQAEIFKIHLNAFAVFMFYMLRLCTSFINPCLYILCKPDFRQATCLKRKKERPLYSELTRTSVVKTSTV